MSKSRKPASALTLLCSTPLTPRQARSRPLETAMKTIAILALATILSAPAWAPARADGRVGSHRVGGHGPHGKGSHYAGGHQRGTLSKMLHKL